MAESKFKSGDVVELISGSPKMTVSLSDDGFTYCYYFDYNTNKLTEALKLPTVVLKASEEKNQT